MRQERWRAILGARADVDKLVAAAVGDYPRHGPPRAVSAAPRSVAAAEPPRGWRDPVPLATARVATAPVAIPEQETLHQLHQHVHARIEALRAALATEPGSEQAMLALVLFFDERIMGHLPEFLATSWPLLQTRLTGRKTGGSDFFRLIDRLLDADPPPGFVFEVYYFCLASGFEGQYAADLEALEGYKHRLRSRIAAPEPEQQPHERATAASPVPLRSLWLPYVAALFGVLVVTVALTAWSNR